MTDKITYSDYANLVNRIALLERLLDEQRKHTKQLENKMLTLTGHPWLFQETARESC